jgi:YVTN family beta-propeller protein
VSAEDADTVDVIDVAKREQVASVKVGGRPRGIAFTPDGKRAYVACELANTVYAIDATKHAVLAAIPAGNFSNGVTMRPDGARVFISNGRDGTVSVIDTSTNAIVATVKVGNRPWNMAITPGRHETLRRKRPLELRQRDRCALECEGLGHCCGRAALGSRDSMMRRARVALAIACAAWSTALVCGENPATEIERAVVEVIGITPIPGLGMPLRDVPSAVQSFSDETLRRRQALDATEYMERSFAGVSTNAAQANPLQPDVNFRGFTASHLLGVPQGLSVFVDGVRVNEAFGDVVNWDLIPRNAISSANLISGSNPVFGLNTLGGALSVLTKSGFSYPGYSARVLGGSFGRKIGEFEAAATARTPTSSSRPMRSTSAAGASTRRARCSSSSRRQDGRTRRRISTCRLHSRTTRSRARRRCRSRCSRIRASLTPGPTARRTRCNS